MKPKPGKWRTFLQLRSCIAISRYRSGSIRFFLQICMERSIQGLRLFPIGATRMYPAELGRCVGHDRPLADQKLAPPQSTTTEGEYSPKTLPNRRSRIAD